MRLLKLGLIGAGVLVAGAGYALSLEEALLHGLAENPTIMAARSQMGVQNENKQQEFANFLPSVTAGGSYYSQQVDVGSGSEAYHPATGTLSVSQPLFRSGATLAAYRSAKAALAAEEQTYAETVQQTLLRIVQAYMDLLTAQDVYMQQDNLVYILTEERKAAQVRFKQGDLTRTDVAQADARVASAQAGLLQAEAVRIQAEQVLEALLGQPVTDEELSWPHGALAGLPDDMDTAVVAALAAHPTLLAAEFDVESAQEDIAEAKADQWLEVDAAASFSHTENGSTGTQTTKQVGLTASLPLYRGGSLSSAVREAVYKQDAAQAAYEAARRQVVQEARNAVTAHRVAQATEEAYATALEAARLAAEGVSKEAGLGSRDVLDVLNAEKELLDAQVNLTQAKADTLVTAYRLLAAVGKFTGVPLQETPRDLAEE